MIIQSRNQISIIMKVCIQSAICCENYRKIVAVEFM